MKNLFIASLIVNVLLLVVVGIFGYLFVQKKVIFAPTAAPVAQKQVTVATAEINKSWDLPATSSAKTSPLSLTITSVKKSDKITSGKTQYTTKNNKAFLIVNTTVDNKGATLLQVGPSDFVKLMENNVLVDATYKALASSIDAGKSYQSSMVFLVDQSAKSFVLSIGNNVGKSNTLQVSF